MNIARCRAVVVAGLLAAMTAIPCAAHEDTPLRRDPDGRLHGLPTQYGPASLKIGYGGDNNRQRIAALVLTVHGHRTALPDCLLRDIKTRRKQNVQVQASWYHDTTHLPPYVNVLISGPYTRDMEWPGESESFIFSLETGRLLHYRRDEKAVRLRRFWMGPGLQHVVVDVRKLCGTNALAGLLDPAYSMR